MQTAMRPDQLTSDYRLLSRLFFRLLPYQILLIVINAVNGIGDVFELKSRNLRVRPEMIDCDLYRFLEGDEEAVNAYFGEYMSQYTWASNTEAQLAQLKKQKN